MSTKQDRAWEEYGERFRKEIMPHLLASAWMVHIGSEPPDVDAADIRAATELGLMLLLDRPLLIVVPPGVTISRSLARAAAEVVRDWDPHDEAAQERLVEAIHRMKERA